jgi:hypothetical protein
MDMRRSPSGRCTGWPAVHGRTGLTVAAMAMMGLTICDVIGRTLYFRLISIAIISVAAIGLLVSLAHLRYHALA